MKFTKDLCGSRLEILIHSEWEFSDLIQECFDITEQFEIKYSRFIEWNYLSKLNTNKQSIMDSELESILKLCLKVSDITNGYFDITIQPTLENAWYWISNNKLKENIWYKNIVIQNNKVILNNWVSLDLWSVWKWYIVDKIYNVLSKKIDRFSINFWWDIRISGKQKIQLEDPLDDNKIIWSIELLNKSIASSSWKKRQFWWKHHLINATTKESQNDKIIVYVTHSLAIFADIFATALFVTPLKDSLNILSSIPWLEAMIINEGGQIYKSKWFEYKQ